MENATKALEMAAGVLLGVIILAVIVYFFGSISLWPQEQDDIQTAEQLSDFNLEYEVYDKKAMYGTDVISCLTKAQSNNEKYVEGGSFLTGSKYGDEFWINVYIHINSNLKESITVYRIENSRQSQIFSNTDNKLGNITMKDMGFIIPDDGYTNFKPETFISTLIATPESELTGTSYIDITSKCGIDDKYNAQLYNPSDRNAETPLQNLLKFASTNAKQVVNNRISSGIGADVWNTATWQTGLYDFKTRRFKCDLIEYSKETGRVNALYFSQI